MPIDSEEPATRTDNTARARWLLSFFEECPQEWDDGKKLHWRRAWARFLRGTTPVDSFDLPRYPQIRHWWEELHRGFARLAKGDKWTVSIRANADLRLTFNLLRSEIKSIGDEESVWAKVSESLLAIGKSFRFCKRDTCKKPFIANRRQKYCSGRCQGTASKRRYRHRHRI